MKSRIVLPDGNGITFDFNICLKIGDQLDPNLHGGLRNYRVCEIWDFTAFSTRYYMVK